MAFSRLPRLDPPPPRGVARTAAVMLLSLLASLLLLQLLGGRCASSSSPPPLSARLSEDPGSLRTKRLAHRWSSPPAAAAELRASGAAPGGERAGESAALPPPDLPGESGRVSPRFAGKLSPLGDGSRKLPGALIVGVKKGGTRALLEFLRVHPDIRAVGAEPHFFDRNYDNGLEWYR